MVHQFSTKHRCKAVTFVLMTCWLIDSRYLNDSTTVVVRRQTPHTSFLANNTSSQGKSPWIVAGDTNDGRSCVSPYLLFPHEAGRSSCSPTIMLLLQKLPPFKYGYIYLIVQAFFRESRLIQLFGHLEQHRRLAPILSLFANAMNCTERWGVRIRVWFLCFDGQTNCHFWNTDFFISARNLVR
jgi:hypothetical protein